MIRSKTVFIVGAGASNEVELPLGQQLTKEIAGALNFRPGNQLHTSMLVRAGLSVAAQKLEPFQGKQNEIFQKAVGMSDALATAASIDVFIDNHADDPAIGLIGKVGIAACLIEAERRSMLRYAPDGGPFDLRQVEKTWYARLFHILAEGVRRQSIHQIFENVAFVVFNYDRCLEHFLARAIASRFFLTPDEAAQLVQERCPIIHPYGVLAPLQGNDAIRFGEHYREGMFPAGDAMVRMAQGLRTFTEAQKDDDSQRAKAQINGASCLVFLGFGFHRQNVEFLTVLPRPGNKAVVQEFRSTAFGMSDSNRTQVITRILSMVGGSFHPRQNDWLFDGKCNALIDAEHLFLSR
jgi:hypothetical protein